MVKAIRVSFSLFCWITAGASSRLVLAGDVSGTGGVVLSIQPGAFSESHSPYLNQALGGKAGGIVIAGQRRMSESISLGLELSTTSYVTTQQQGRFISGSGCNEVNNPAACPLVVSQERDTIVTALLGIRTGPVEVKGGLGFALAQTRQGGESYDYSTPPAITGGLDVQLPRAARVAPSLILRYSRLFRDSEKTLYTGVGSNIFRIGFGVRVGGSPN
jgi:hypothetical protein